MLFYINEKSFICKAKLHILVNEKSIVEMFLKSVIESVRISAVVSVFKEDSTKLSIIMSSRLNYQTWQWSCEFTLKITLPRWAKKSGSDI